MNRRAFFRTLLAGGATAVVAPEVLLRAPKWSVAPTHYLRPCRYRWCDRPCPYPFRKGGIVDRERMSRIVTEQGPEFFFPLDRSLPIPVLLNVRRAGAVKVKITA